MICMDSTIEPELDSDEEVLAAVKYLNRGKAPDEYGVTAEQVYYGGQIKESVVKSLINNILLNKSVLESLILGILNFILKNKGV